MPATLKRFGRSFKENTFSSLHVRNYRLFFIGQLISLSGTWMQIIAQGWLVLTITNSGTQVGIVAALEFLPLLLLGPWGGVIADRYNKRKLLALAYIFAGAVTTVLAVIVAFDLVQIWMLYISATLLGLQRLIEAPARQSLVYEMVGEKDLKNAVSLYGTLNNLARVLGPSLGGIVIASTSLSFCFFFNAFSFFASVALLPLIRKSELFVPQRKQQGSGSIREGFRYVLDTPRIRNTLIMSALIGTFVYEFQVSLPIFAKQTFLGTATDYASLMTAFGLGAVVGGLVAASRTHVSMRHYTYFVICLAASLTITALMPTLAWAQIGLFVVGFFGINTNTLANTIIQLEVKPEMRGRVMALWSMAMMGSTPIGGPIVGYIGQHLGGRYALGIGALAACIAALFGYISWYARHRAQRVTPEAEEERSKMESASTKLP